MQNLEAQTKSIMVFLTLANHIICIEAAVHRRTSKCFLLLL